MNPQVTQQIAIARQLPTESKLAMAMELFVWRFRGDAPVMEMQTVGLSDDVIADRLLDSVESGEPVAFKNPGE